MTGKKKKQQHKINLYLGFILNHTLSALLVRHYIHLFYLYDLLTKGFKSMRSLRHTCLIYDLRRQWNRNLAVKTIDVVKLYVFKKRALRYSGGEWWTWNRKSSRYYSLREAWCSESLKWSKVKSMLTPHNSLSLFTSLKHIYLLIQLYTDTPILSLQTFLIAVIHLKALTLCYIICRDQKRCSQLRQFTLWYMTGLLYHNL